MGIRPDHGTLPDLGIRAHGVGHGRPVTDTAVDEPSVRADLALVAEGPAADDWLSIAQAYAGFPGTGRPPGLPPA